MLCVPSVNSSILLNLDFLIPLPGIALQLQNCVIQNFANVLSTNYSTVQTPQQFFIP